MSSWPRRARARSGSGSPRPASATPTCTSAGANGSRPFRWSWGTKASGIVTALGPGVSDLAEGDHVVLSWVAPCGQCRYCRRAGRPAARWPPRSWPPAARCRTAPRGSAAHGETVYHYLGVSSFAEEAVVPASGAIKVRDDAPLEVIALVGCAVATGVGAVTNTAAVEPGAQVAVIGCGGVGLSVIQGARLAGAGRIVAMDLRPR